jgi:hypothetical protein
VTLRARHFARLCRERMVAQGMTEEEAEEACAEEDPQAETNPEPEQLKLR